ncbi:spore coat U domain-containing protein [Xanthobacteraceae bacterium A53D]
MLAALVLALPASPWAGQAMAATATGNLNVTITITAECLITAVSAVDFGSHGVIAANVDNAGSVSVQCTNTTPYTIGLGVGNGAGATTAIRKLTGPSAATINYSLYQNAARTTVWGNTVNVDRVTGNGTGAAVAIPIFGRIPPQTTPAIGAYSDIVQIQVEY